MFLLSQRVLLLVLVLFGAVVNAVPARAEDTISTRSLLRELTDLSTLARAPLPAYESRQASSHDRASKRAGTPDWFANNDSGQFVRAETRDGRVEQVLMETQAPGALARFWSANPAGTVRFYFDGHRAPDITAPMDKFLDGQTLAVPDPLSASRARGHCLFLPISWARACKITVESPGSLYYIVDYRSYAPGTPVSTFDAARIGDLATEMARAAARLRAPQEMGVAPRHVAPFKQSIAPAQTVSLGEFKGEQAISALAVRVPANISETALRLLMLRIWFDGQKCIEAPVGDFFGSAPGVNPFQSLPLGVSVDGEMQSRWVMPFRRHARVELVNWGAQPVEVSGTVGVAPLAWTARSQHFHASGRAWKALPTRPMRDLNFLRARGKGRLVGLTYSIDNPSRQWWGEGDEKITHDGATFPDWFGTGTEDFFGYAWSSPIPFGHALFNQTRSGVPDNYGRSSLNRFLMLDSIPFERGLQFDMEMWHWDDVNVNLVTVAYWYGAPLARDAAPLAPANGAMNEQTLPVAPMPPYRLPRVAGALEGETLPLISVSGGQTEVQNLRNLSGEQQLWWHDGRVGDILQLSFAAPAAGRYRVEMRRVKAPDYGIVQVQINDQNAGAPLDGWAPRIETAPAEDLGVFDLKAGKNNLTVRIVGSNPAAEARQMFGLDYLKLEPAPKK